MSRRYAPDRGDPVWLEFNPQAGHEQAGHRPALVISPSAYDRRTRLALFRPVTNQVKGYPFEVPIPMGLAVGGVVLADQITSLDWRARRPKLMVGMPPEGTAAVLERASVQLA